jgi:hypothetical protein
MKRRRLVLFAVAGFLLLTAVVYLVTLSSDRPATSPAQPAFPASIAASVAREASPAPSPRPAPAPPRPPVVEMTPAEMSQDEVMKQKAAGDPVALAIPILTGVPAEKQLEYIRWVRTLPEGRLIANMPEFNTRDDLSLAEIARLATAKMESLESYLSSKGVQAPELPPGFVSVQMVPKAPPEERSAPAQPADAGL